MTLVWPSREQLDSYADALRRGWSPDNVRGLAATEEELARIGHDPDAFVYLRQPGALKWPTSRQRIGRNGMCVTRKMPSRAGR